MNMNLNLSEDILSLLLRAENEYHAVMKGAVKDAENYADDCKKKQKAYLEDLKRDWHLFEQSENSKLEKMLFENKRELETKMAEFKNQLKISQKNKAELISERLKEDVISPHGNR